MIWNSIPFMTAIDLMIIAMTIYAIWRCQLIGPSKRPSAPQIGLRLIALGVGVGFSRVLGIGAIAFAVAFLSVYFVMQWIEIAYLARART